jgi:hypothetical protein
VFASDVHELDGCDIDEKAREILLNNIRRRLTPQAVKCRAGRAILVVFACFTQPSIDVFH